MVYLDNAATSFPKPPGVAAAVAECLEGLAGSAARSAGPSAEAAGRIILEARQQAAGLLGVADPRQVVFMASATDALNAGLKGLLRPGDRAVTTSLEHNAVARPLRFLERQGVVWERAPCTPTGQTDLDQWRRTLREPTRLAVVCHASNVLGTIAPLSDLIRIAHDEGAYVLVDASQTVGALPLNVAELGVDALAFTGHKALLGPQGTGGLYLRPGLNIESYRQGGTGSQSEQDVQPEFLPDKFESGTPNTPGLAGLAVAAQYIGQQGVRRIREHELALTSALLEGLQQMEGVEVYGPVRAEERVGLVSFNVGSLDPAEVQAVGREAEA